MIMMGQHDRSEALFYYFRLEDQVPEHHLLRLIEKHISFRFVRERLQQSYSASGRPSIDPELLLRILLIGYLYGITSERKLKYIPLPDLEARRVEEKVRTYLAELSSPTLHNWIRVVDDTSKWLWDVAMGRVVADLRGVEHVAIIKGGLLGLLPLHAAWSPDPQNPDEGCYALDTAAFSYLPSARSLAATVARSTSPLDMKANKAIVVANPSPVSANPLRFAEDEADVVKWHFGILRRQKNCGTRALRCGEFQIYFQLLTLCVWRPGIRL